MCACVCEDPTRVCGRSYGTWAYARIVGAEFVTLSPNSVTFRNIKLARMVRAKQLTQTLRAIRASEKEQKLKVVPVTTTHD